MEIIINGETKIVDNEITIKSVMETLGYNNDLGAVAVNMTFVPSDKYNEVVLKEGDEVEILAPVCGG